MHTHARTYTQMDSPPHLSAPLLPSCEQQHPISVYIQRERDEFFESESSGALLQMDSTLYTQDGSTDIHGRPSVKTKTGGWKEMSAVKD